MPKGRTFIRRVGRAFVEAAGAMWTHEVPRDAAAISYFSLFALFPAILVLFAVVDYFLGVLQLEWSAVVDRIVMLFPGSEPFWKKNLMQFTDPSPALLLACFIVVIWGSTWVFTFLENALNRAWDVPRRRTFWESRVRNIALLLLGGIMLLTSAGITVVLEAQKALADQRFARDQIVGAMWRYIIAGAGFGMAILVFLFVYKLMPDLKVRWGEAISGAIVATVLWEVDWKIFAKLVPTFDSQKVYGTTGFIIALLTWVYASSLITLYGGNFSARLHRPEGPSKTSVTEASSLERVSGDKKIRIFPRIGQ